MFIYKLTMCESIFNKRTILNRTLRFHVNERKYSMPKVVNILPQIPRHKIEIVGTSESFDNRPIERNPYGKPKPKSFHIRKFNRILRGKSKSLCESELKMIIRIPIPNSIFNTNRKLLYDESYEYSSNIGIAET